MEPNAALKFDTQCSTFNAQFHKHGSRCNDKCLDVHRFYLMLENNPFQENSFSLKGQTPANKFWGSYTFDSLGTIQMYDVTTTRHYLPQPLGDIEARFLDLIERADYYEISESQLWLFSAEEVLIFRSEYKLKNRLARNDVQ